jgi:putative methyltransferase (TIGR04325 family)
MRENHKKIIKSFIPPFVFNLFKGKRKYGFFGNYKDWQSALKDSKGYDDPAILEKVKNSLLKVKNGEAVYERDSVLFDHIEYSWPILTSLLWIASKNNNRLNLIDFGGSLGSSYFQNINFLKHLSELKWNVIEQNNFLECGKKYFENDQLKFKNNIESCMTESRPQAILLSSVIEYIEKPYDILEEIVKNKIPYVIVDRTSFFKDTNLPDRITIQKVSPRIYDAVYPCWILNEEKFKKFMTNNGYSIKAEFNSNENFAVTADDNMIITFKGHIFELK